MNILEAMGLAPSKQDNELRKLITQSYSSVRVVGRGTINIDPQEVRQSHEFKQALAQAKAIVGAR